MNIEIVLYHDEVKKLVCAELHKKYGFGNFPDKTSIRMFEDGSGETKIRVELDTKELEETGNAMFAKVIKDVESDL